MDVRARLEKLLAIAASGSVHEAAIAAERAQRLIAEHRLEAWAEARDTDPIEDDRDHPLERARRLRKWKSALASALAEANGCVAYTADLGGEKAIYLVGRRSDRDAVRMLWDWLVTRVEWLSASHGGGKGKKWHESFRIGAVATIAERLAAAEVEAVQAVAPAALVRVDTQLQAHRAELDAFVEERLGLGRGRALYVNPAAYAAGRASAEDLPLPDGR